MNEIRFSCTALSGTGKSGVMKPDEHGRYTQVLGGMDTYNSAGEYYVYQGAKQLFEESGALRRRISDGVLKSEVGHPKPLPGMTNAQYAKRIMHIEETNVCALVTDIWLDFNTYKNKNGAPIVAIIGKVAPAGPKGDALKAAYERPGENVCFSLRAFTYDERVNGIMYRTLAEVVTFDWVTEPGIEIAKKFQSPGLESFCDVTISERTLAKISQDTIKGVGMEESSAMAKRLMSRVSKQENIGQRPVFAGW